MIEVAPGEFRQVLHTMIYSRQFQDIELAQINDRGELVFWASFTDGSSGIFLATVPEPSVAAMLILCAFGLSGRRDVAQPPRL